MDALQKIHRNGAYSNVVLEAMSHDSPLNAADQALTVRLVRGVLEHRITLDYLLNRCSSVPVRKMRPVIADILRTAVYQLLYLDKIPESAAVNEAVNLTKACGQRANAGFVNGVLRGFLRRREELLAAIPEGRAGDDVRLSFPSELLKRWSDSYGYDTAIALAEAMNRIPPSCIRVNTVRTTPEAFEARLREADIGFEPVEGLPACYVINDPARLKALAFGAGSWYYAQDAASQWCCRALGAQPGERIADVCAAPGGKSFTLAQYLNNDGAVEAGDLYPAKVDAMNRRAAHLGLTCVRAAVRDAAAAVPEEERGAFDRVLCDAPCSGLGVIRRRPEIRYRSLSEVAGLPDTQYAILCRAAERVRPGGALQYSTCTLNPAENEAVAARFLREHTEFVPRILPLDACFARLGREPSHTVTLFPHVHGTDGFFVAGFERRR